MKKTLIHFTLPLTFISFAIATKWWYGIIVDGVDTFFYGFPLIYKCKAFHTSLATQYFLMEALFNFVVYFTFWLAITLLIKRFWAIHIPKLLSISFWVVFCVLCSGYAYLSYELNDHQYSFKRDFDVKIIDSGFTIFETNDTSRAILN